MTPAPSAAFAVPPLACPDPHAAYWAEQEARRAAIRPRTAPSSIPANCAGCRKPLTEWARRRGFTFCDRQCRELHRAA